MGGRSAPSQRFTVQKTISDVSFQILLRTYPGRPWSSHPHSMHENQRPQAKGEQVVRGRGRQTQHLQNPQEGEAAPPSALWLPPPRMGKQSQGHADRWQTQPAGAAPLLLGGLLDPQPSPEGDGQIGDCCGRAGRSPAQAGRQQRGADTDGQLAGGRGPRSTALDGGPGVSRHASGKERAHSRPAVRAPPAAPAAPLLSAGLAPPPPSACPPALSPSRGFRSWL